MSLCAMPLLIADAVMIGLLLNAEQRVLQREERGAYACRYANLGVHVLDVVIRGFGRDHQALGNVFCREPLRDQSQHLHFSVCEPRRPVALRCWRRLAGRVEDGLHHARVEQPHSSLSAQFLSGSLR